MASLETVNEKMLMAIEMLMNNNDPKADPNEKIDVETAKAIADLGKVCVEGYKVKAQALGILSKAENPNRVIEMVHDTGIVKEDKTLE